ncbi:GNAT family N-acetyltransferase [Paenibacillus sediminis]|uniref:RimJ/RimL family protein N-acetyltransferase n=1 Tax=Paenibacillus sediminis TaxID=664909 RepID=A0ABS4H2V6_9BACL|nr:GNAT family N-acetyltransferase [Paenibacillus sediminis]MBP1936856.1 RimJ/RimL family protein N-acetyltransferase [Paenibacillus sediminis]
MSINPILISFPEEFETNRLIIRAPQWGDGAIINEAIRESVDELRPWLPFARTVPSVDESEAYVRKARLDFLARTDLVLHLFDKHTGEFVGSSGLHRINWDIRHFEIGYWVRTSRSGQGYMTEAVNGITNFAITHLEANRIEIRCNSRNISSTRVAKRAGYTLEGVLRSISREETGELANINIFSKVRGYEF